jgi:hypothetical protein
MVEVEKQRTQESQLEIITKVNVEVMYKKHEIQMLMTKRKLMYHEFKGFDKEL